jgi:hypothetical protein
MNIRFWTIFGLILMMLSACAGPQTRTQKGGVYGAAGGAAAGAIVGQAIGHDTKATLEGAAIGAAVWPVREPVIIWINRNRTFSRPWQRPKPLLCSARVIFYL